MAQIIECIPNVSEGRNLGTIKELEYAVTGTEGVALLNTDTNIAANRTVFTFAGEAEHVFRAAGKLIAKASELIDMSKHTGEHPRMGAVDVCPFVPVSGINTEELSEMTETFAQQIAKELGIAIYLYEQNARKPHRKRLEQIRKGEYEALAGKINTEDWAPDYGPTQFNAKFGAMVCGTRDYLIAYNINLQTKEVSAAKNIAGQIRESGYSIMSGGAKRTVAGKFSNLKAIGWYIEDFGCSQVSTNITNIHTTPMHQVFETVKKLAQETGCEVNGSELIGLVPFMAMQEAGEFYAPGIKPAEQIREAIRVMGLNSVKKFDPNERILEIKAGWRECL